MTEKYTCVMCQHEYPLVRNEIWNDEIAREEFEANFPGEDITETHYACDDCHRLMMFLSPPRARSTLEVFFNTYDEPVPQKARETFDEYLTIKKIDEPQAAEFVNSIVGTK